MDFIVDVLNMSFKSNKADVFSSGLAIIFFFIAEGVTVAFFMDSSYIILMFIIGLLIAPIMGFLLGMKLSKKLFKKRQEKRFESSKLYKNLEKNGYLCKFMQTINEEIELKDTIKYSCAHLGFGLLVTKTWFVYIDEKYPKVVKTKDIVKISEEHDTTTSTAFICLELKDKTYIRINKLRLDDIENEIKNKYPNILIGYGIIEE